MWWMIFRGLVAGLVVIGVTELSNRHPRLGALLLTLPIISIVAFILTWQKNHDQAAITRLARETLVLVPLGLPFFLPLAFAERLGLGFWQAFGGGIASATLLIGAWLLYGPR